MISLAAVEFANSAFYDAFSTANIDQMSELWASSDAVFCCHPGLKTADLRSVCPPGWCSTSSCIAGLIAFFARLQ